MSSIKVKDETGKWIYIGGEASSSDLVWTSISQSTFYIPAEGGNFEVTTANDQEYVFAILPSAPANGTVVRAQVTDGGASYCYLQSSGTDTIDHQVVAVLARSVGQLIETVRYYNGRWFRLDGNYTYSPPPLVGPYEITPTTGPTIEVSPSISSVGVSLIDTTNTTMTGLYTLTYP
jgi:hypothetical protein